MQKSAGILFVQIGLISAIAVIAVQQLDIVDAPTPVESSSGGSRLELSEPAFSSDGNLQVEEAVGEPQPLNAPLQSIQNGTNQGSSPNLQEQNQGSLQPNAGSNGIDREDL